MARYLTMRRHTVGIGNSQPTTPDDATLWIAHHQPNNLLQPGMFAPGGCIVPHMYPPQDLSFQGDAPTSHLSVVDQHLLKPPQLFVTGMVQFLVVESD